MRFDLVQRMQKHRNRCKAQRSGQKNLVKIAPVNPAYADNGYPHALRDFRQPRDSNVNGVVFGLRLVTGATAQICRPCVRKRASMIDRSSASADYKGRMYA